MRLNCSTRTSTTRSGEIPVMQGWPGTEQAVNAQGEQGTVLVSNWQSPRAPHRCGSLADEKMTTHGVEVNQATCAAALSRATNIRALAIRLIISGIVFVHTMDPVGSIDCRSSRSWGPPVSRISVVGRRSRIRFRSRCQCATGHFLDGKPAPGWIKIRRSIR